MAASDRIVGTAVVLDFLPTGGTPGADEKVLTSDWTTFKENRKVDTVDVTAGNETDRYEKATIEAIDFSVMMFDANQAYQSDILPGATGLLSVYPEGKGTGLPYHTFNCLLTGYSEDFSFDGALEIDLAGVRLGAMVVEVGSTQP